MTLKFVSLLKIIAKRKIVRQIYDKVKYKVVLDQERIFWSSRDFSDTLYNGIQLGLITLNPLPSSFAMIPLSIGLNRCFNFLQKP